MPPQISVIIATQRRPASLRIAARSVLRQQSVDPTLIELVVVDNDQVPSAQEGVAALADEAPFSVAYVHEPKPGVSSARNAAMSKATGSLIAFLDDDEEAPAEWLANLVAAQARYDADVVFGPVNGRAPDTIKRHRTYLEAFFSRAGPAVSGPIDGYYGCGNSLLRRAALPDPQRPFDVERDGIGGEDDVLFAQMKARGARFVWAVDAPVWEDPAPERLSLDYALRRALAYGQGGTNQRANATPPDWAGVALSMGTGMGQALVFGALAGVQWLTRRPGRAAVMDRAARGLGKVLWWKRFHKQFYGLPAPDGAGS